MIKIKVSKAIETRRAYRSLAKITINQDIINSLVKAAQLSPSCNNKQPWRFVFVTENPKLENLKKKALNDGNKWAEEASMIVAVFSKQEDDCVIGERIYYGFDTGIAVGAMLLQATELGLVAHPIAGYSPAAVHTILEIPKEYQIITLIIIGKQASKISESLSESQKKSEKERPNRLAYKELISLNKYFKK